MNEVKNKRVRATLGAILIALLCTGCGKIYDYELQRIAEICGGYEQIKKTWIDVSTVRAYCKDGNQVSAKD